MATKAQERRAAQKEALIHAAEQRVVAEGLSALKARDLARDIGVALGAIYNLVPDMEELRYHVIARGLKRLDAALAQATARCREHDPMAILDATAQAYLTFARENQNLWRCIFRPAEPDSRPVPDWLTDEQHRLFARLVEPLSQLMPDSPAEERRVFAFTLFTAVHGVIDMALQERVFAVPPDRVAEQLTFLLQAIAAGLRRKR